MTDDLPPPDPYLADVESTDPADEDGFDGFFCRACGFVEQIPKMRRPIPPFTIGTCGMCDGGERVPVGAA